MKFCVGEYILKVVAVWFVYVKYTP